MDELMPFLIVAAPLIALAWFLHRRSSHRGKHPLWPAFSATAGVAMFLFAEAVGYCWHKGFRYPEPDSAGKVRVAR